MGCHAVTCAVLVSAAAAAAADAGCCKVGRWFAFCWIERAKALKALLVFSDDQVSVVQGQYMSDLHPADIVWTRHVVNMLLRPRMQVADPL